MCIMLCGHLAICHTQCYYFADGEEMVTIVGKDSASQRSFQISGTYFTSTTDNDVRAHAIQHTCLM